MSTFLNYVLPHAESLLSLAIFSSLVLAAIKLLELFGRLAVTYLAVKLRLPPSLICKVLERDRSKPGKNM